MKAQSLIACMALCVAAAAELPRKGGAIESYPGIKVELGQVTAADGTQLRSIVTRPSAATGKLPAVFFAGWLSCDSMEAPNDADGFAALMRRVVARSGMMTYRVDKPGVGDSQGDCAQLDFDRELEGYRAAWRAMLADARVDATKLYVVGLSNGGGFAPLVVQRTPVRGYVSIGGWGRTWLEHMLEHERVRLALAGRSPSETTQQLRQFGSFYDQYLNRGKTPGQVIAADPGMKAIWYDEPGGQYGRPAAFYQDLQALNLAEAWSGVTAPTLIIRGEFDWIMSHNDAIAIRDAIAEAHPELVTYAEPQADHGLMRRKSMAESFAGKPSAFHEGVATMVLDFLKVHAQ
jgi:pimeloyl-ACP methyl ester carboxylesterase